MRGMGTIVNVLAVIGGGCLGLLARRGIGERFQEMLIQAMGVSIVFIGIAGAMTGLLKAGDDGSLGTTGSMLLIASLVVGSLLGEWINIERWLERFGVWLREKARGQNDSRFVEGFVTTSLCVCVGAMAVVGSIEDGLSGDATMLNTKAVLDGGIVLVFASTYGKGAVFSAVPIALLQGSITLCASLLAPVLSDAVVASLSFVGSVLIFCVGANLCFARKFRVANMLPSLLIAGVLAALL